MRVTHLDISGFRGFSARQRFDLDGDVVLVVGANGQGKTSLFDAIHWGITGQVSRLPKPDSIVSLYSDSGEARVEVGLVSEGAQPLEVTRHFDGETTEMLLAEGRASFRSSEAELELLRRLWPQGLAANDQWAALRSAVERGVYLQQDVLTGFLTADTDQDRFAVISELIGAGRVTELQASLERSRRAWSRVTTQRTQEVERIERQLARLEEQVPALSHGQTDSGVPRAAWDDWWDTAIASGVAEADRRTVDSLDAPSALDVAMRQLRAIHLSLEHRDERLRALAGREGALPPSDVELDALRQSAREAAAAAGSARAELDQAERIVADINRRQLAVRSGREEMGTLAELAIRHLDERCPVCEQEHDMEATRAHLESLLRDRDSNVSRSQTSRTSRSKFERRSRVPFGSRPSWRTLSDSKRCGHAKRPRFEPGSASCPSTSLREGTPSMQWD